ncbi:MAG: helicase-related protein, partial [Polyangiales bacterium]
MTRWYATVAPLPMTPLPIRLPIDEVLPSILDVLAVRRSVVLQAPPGAGKTTRVPPALLDRIEGEIVVLEPRRLAARLSARRVAEELGEKVGDRVGYEVRFERAISASTRLSYVTEGILTRRLIDDPSLRGVGAVVLDEFHERHLQGDLALALLKRLEHGPKLVVMSATLDAAPVARYLDDAPIVTSEGKRFEVSFEHLAQVDDRPLASQVASAVRRLVNEGLTGDVLVFLPGAAEIRKATESCAAIANEANLLVLPLHGELPPAAQDRAIARADRRKVVLSTNVAETSITIDGVVAVIDSGLARIAGHDPWTGRATLEVAKISRASAAQRAGRAGRTAPGRALRLYTKGDHDTRREHDLPEIARVDLAETVLQLRASGIDPPSFGFLDAPARPSLDAADALLRSLGALDTTNALTKIGERMVRFPLSPRLSRLIVEAEARGVPAEGCALAAILSEGRDLFARSFDGPALRNDDAPSDLLARLDALDEASRGGSLDADRARRAGLDVGAAHAIDRVRKQLERGLCGRFEVLKVHPDDALRMAILAAHPDRVGRRRVREGQGRVGIDREIVLSSGGTATLEETSVVKTAPW